MPALPSRCPFADWEPFPSWPTGRYTDTVNYKVVWHTTQGYDTGLYPTYRSGGGIPKFTIFSTGRIAQHYDMNRFDRALRNQSGGVQTNLDGAISIEIVGFAGTEHTPDQLEAIERLSAWLTEIGIPGVWLNGRPTAARRRNGTSRLSQSAWDNGSGHCGHIDVPENDHTDPGFVTKTWRAVEAGWIDAPPGVNEPAPTQEDFLTMERSKWHKIWNDALDQPDQANPVVEEIQAMLRWALQDAQGKPASFYGFTIDGKPGEVTQAAMVDWKAEVTKTDRIGALGSGPRMTAKVWDEMNRQAFMVNPPGGNSKVKADLELLAMAALEARDFASEAATELSTAIDGLETI